MKRKNANGEGTIVRRASSQWLAALTLEGGKRTYLYGKTRQEVARKLAEARWDRDKGLPAVPDERQTVGQYLQRWLQAVKPTVRESAWIRYEQLLRVHAIPALGKTSLAKLSPQPAHNRCRASTPPHGR